MKHVIAAILLGLSYVATAAEPTWLLPGTSTPSRDAAPQTLPADLGGALVSYDQFGVNDGPETFTVASSRVQGVYPVIGVAGPCPANETCPNLDVQAYKALEVLAYQANRARRLR